MMQQLSSINAVVIHDFNKDGLPDLLMGGNQFGFQPMFGRLDASLGYVLLNIGIAENSRNFSVGNVFPNPSHGITCIPVTANNEHLKISLLNILGQNVETIFDGVCNGERKYFVNTSSLPAGVYQVVTKTPTSNYTQKLIVK